MRTSRILLATLLALLVAAGPAPAADPSWPREITFALLSTENAADITRRWSPIIAQLGKDLGIAVKYVAATDYRGTIEALKQAALPGRVVLETADSRFSTYRR